MKVEISKAPKFQPFTLSLEIETLDEAKVLWSMFNQSSVTIEEYMEEDDVQVEDTVVSEVTNRVWHKLDKLIQAHGGVR